MLQITDHNPTLKNFYLVENIYLMLVGGSYYYVHFVEIVSS